MHLSGIPSTAPGQLGWEWAKASEDAVAVTGAGRWEGIPGE